MLTALDPSDIELHALQRGSTVLRFQAGLAAPCLPLAVLVMSAPLSMAWAGSLHRTSQHLGERERERHLPELSLSLSLSSPQQRYRPLRLHSASLTPPTSSPSAAREALGSWRVAFLARFGRKRGLGSLVSGRRNQPTTLTDAWACSRFQGDMPHNDTAGPFESPSRLLPLPTFYFHFRNNGDL